MSFENVEKVVTGMKNKSCTLDPIPTSFVKNCVDILVPVLSRIVNVSFNTGVFPSNCKNALVHPMIKKAELDQNILKNYRPVSNCSFLDKFLEKCAYVQINNYLNANSLYGEFQSAYREGHSTETALLRVHNDIMLALDVQKDVILVMLDLSAAFDTIDHKILLERLRVRFGMGGSVLNWIRSFMCGRTQQVVINQSMVSEARKLKYGVPQGSILGPLLFSLYVTPLEDVIRKHGCHTVIFADDTQLYITCDSGDSISVIESCVRDIKEWMSSNFLSLNESKTEVVIFTSRHKRNQSQYVNKFKVGEVTVKTTSIVRNLGVIFDHNGTMSQQVSQICKSASHSLWRIGKIRHLLDNKSAEKIVHAFVTSRLDYCNSILAGLPQSLLQRLQIVQNSAARLIRRIHKHQHLSMTTILKELHWLPIDIRIQFKMLCIVFKCIHLSTAPTYLKDLISVKDSGHHNLRSSDTLTLHTPTKRTLKSYGDRAFAVRAPVLWNALLPSLRQIDSFPTFKCRLKTHLFQKFYKTSI